MDSMNYCCICEYDGTNYFGWAKQNNVLTIQGIVEKTLADIFKKEIKICGSGRTDAKVHATYQVFNFKLNNIKIPTAKIKQILNHHLPDDIKIKSVKIVDNDFHATHSAKSKTYQYIINNDLKSKYAQVRYAHYVWNFNRKINIKLLKKALNKFVGKHNFLSFSTTELKDTIREIFYIKVSCKESLIKIQINGNGFLRNMVRMIVAYAVAISTKQKQIETINHLLKNPCKGSSCLMAPAQGLTLIKVNY